MRLSFIAVATGVTLLAACSHTPMQADASSRIPEAAPKAASAEPSKAQSHAVSQAELDAQEAARKEATWRQQLADLRQAEVLFDFDDFSVKSTYSDMLMKQAQLMKTFGADHLTLQGNGDERGSAEYNLALGQKRADAVRKALTLLGVPDSRIETISFGKEKPRAQCHEESCWAQNRRVDFVHSAGK